MDRILIIEDDPAIARIERDYLELSGFSVTLREDGESGLREALRGECDIILLDVMLPGMDGFAVLRALRQQGVSTPVLMLTARGGVQDRVQGLNLGADYYLPKPFERSELVACLNAITRRKDQPPVRELALGDVRLNPEDAMLSCTNNGKSVRLAAKEYQLMELFLRNPHQLLPKETILERVWGFDNEAEYNNCRSI